MGEPNFCYWPEADIDPLQKDVRFQVQNGHQVKAHRCLEMTQNGHWPAKRKTPFPTTRFDVTLKTISRLSWRGVSGDGDPFNVNSERVVS
jgi:hypothetical protein